MPATTLRSVARDLARSTDPGRQDAASRPSLASRSLQSTGWASLFAAGALLALGARRDPRAPWAPLNVAAHWWWPQQARHRGQVELGLTAVALATHVGACALWATVHEASLARWPARGPAAQVTRGLASALLADVVDYGLTPRRATPGWELELSRSEMAAVYVALGLGLAVRSLRERRSRRGRPRPAVPGAGPLSSPARRHTTGS